MSNSGGLCFQPTEKGYWTTQPENPEAAVAYEERAVLTVPIRQAWKFRLQFVTGAGAGGMDWSAVRSTSSRSSHEDKGASIVFAVVALAKLARLRVCGTSAILCSPLQSGSGFSVNLTPGPLCSSPGINS